MSLRTIQFTQEQARDIAQVSQGDIRQWRKSVPYLAAKPGKAARFTFSDLVGLAIISELTGTLGGRISEIGEGVDALFHALADARPTHLEGIVAVIERSGARLIPAVDFTIREISGPIFMAPCDPIIAAIGARMLPVAPASSQAALPFPPHVVRKGI